jgi:hypothetical protein
MIVACYVVANEEALIAESLRSVKAYVDRYVIVDSVFDTNPHEGTHSTDRTREVAERVCAPVPLTYIESDRKLDEPTARNRYLDELTEGDWCLMLDGDEVLYGHHPDVLALMASLEERSSVFVPIYTVAVNANGYAPEIDRDTYATAPLISTIGFQPRLFRVGPSLEYRVDDLGISHRVFDGADGFVEDTPTTAMYIVNRHASQSYEGYQNDFAWEMGALRRNGAAVPA